MQAILHRIALIRGYWAMHKAVTNKDKMKCIILLGDATQENPSSFSEGILYYVAAHKDFFKNTNIREL